MWIELIKKVKRIIGDTKAAELAEYNLEKAAIKASTAPKAGDKPNDNLSHLLHPMAMFMGQDWLPKSGSPLNYDDLRAMAKNPIIGAIVQTRLNQAAMFCFPSKGYDYGFRIVKSDGSQIEPHEQEECDTITRFIHNAGFDHYGEPNFETLIRKILRDSLVLDQCCAEIVFRRNKLPAYLSGIDGATVRKLEAGTQPDYDKNEAAYCQVIDGNVETTYLKDQLLYGIRNPMTDLCYNAYGMSELELLINIITSLINAEKVNALSLSQGGTQRGILVIKGDITPMELKGFKASYSRAIKNAAEQWEPPVIAIGKEAALDFVTLDRTNKDIEYAQLYEYIVKLATSVYQINPEEVNWVIGTSGASTSFNSGAKDRLAFSVDKGLRPILKFLANLISNQVVKKFNPELSLEFTGLGRTLNDEIDLRIKEVQYYKTVNEVRLDNGLDPIDSGDIILNPQYSTVAPTEDAIVDTINGDEETDVNNPIKDKKTPSPQKPTHKVKKDKKPQTSSDSEDDIDDVIKAYADLDDWY